jgi:putative oxidoreductase
MPNPYGVCAIGNACILSFDSWRNIMTTGTNEQFHPIQSYIPLIARALLSALFLWSGVNKALDPVGTQQYMAAHGMIFTEALLMAAIVIEIGGALSVLLGYRARLGAAALALFLVPATLIFHTNFAEPTQQIMFMKNLAIFGGLLMVVQFGSGPVAIYRD